MRFYQHLRRSTRDTNRRAYFEDLENRLFFANNPSVNTIIPAAGSTAIALNATVQATLILPNGGIDPNTVNSSTVFLYQTAFPNNNSKYVPASVKTSGAGDALLLSPLQDLLPSTSYTFMVTAGVADINGDTFTPFSETFTTGSSIPGVSQSYAFTKVSLPSTAGYAVTDVQMGPDGDLWASTEVGQILRFPLNSDGTLGTPQVITSLQTAYGGNRLISGFAFDPSFVANPSAPMIWVSNTFYALSGATNAPNFSSSLTVMSGTNLGTVKDAIVDLPRSVADHVNDQPVFQPGTNNLFFCQAGENAYGAPDSTWGNRSETLLSAAILEVNTTALNLAGPALNVLTTDAGGTYSPYAAGAPVTLYATGIRNAFPLLFDDKGQLWAPANGSSSGGNAPAGPGGSPPALTDIQQVEEDTLIKVAKGAYYGHPDPARGQFVLNQGNPSSGAIAGLAFTAYPSGTNPDPNYHKPNFIFGLHDSPDGIIEYQGSAFGGKLSGKFLVANYSAPDDIVVLARDSNDNIEGGLSSGTSPAPDYSVSGFQGLNSPVSLVENPATGYLYVSQLGVSTMVLLEPSAVKAQITPSVPRLAFNTIAAGNPNAGPSRTETVTITNTGADVLNLTSIGIVNDPASAPAASDFVVLNAGSAPSSLNTVGTSFTFQIQFSASIVGLETAILQIKSNDATTPTLDIYLHGIGTAGIAESQEPSLVQVLRANGIPTIVGAGPDDVNINTINYPQSPDASSQEVSMQELVAAAPGPVTITPIGSFTTGTQPASEIGFYSPGNGSAITQLYSIAQGDAQTVAPTAVGSTSFNPGSSPFGLYVYFPGIATASSAQDYHYSEDALNAALDPVNPRKIRFFPYETSTGTVVPNTFVMAVEDYNDPTYNTFDNFVAIVSNVSGGASTPKNLAVASNASSGVVLTWTVASGASSYTVAREDPGSTTFVPIATGLTSPTYTDVNVTDGNTYQYEVQAVSSINSSAFTGPVTATRPIAPPGAPSNVQITSSTASGVVLTWTAGAGAISYSVQRKSAASNTFAQIATGLSATTFTDPNVQVGQTYQYEVLSTNATGTSPASAVATTTIGTVSSGLSVTVGKGASKSVRFFNDAGTLTVITLGGKGNATVNFDGTNLAQASNKLGVVVSGSGISIVSISITATVLGNSILTVVTRGGPNTITLGNITTDGSLNAINAPTAILAGSLTVGGSINRIALGSASGTSITAGGFVGMLKIPSVTNVALTAAGAIRNITGANWTSTQPINAPSIGVITITNAELNINTAAIRALHVKGSLSNSTLTLTGAGIQDLALLTAGAIANTTIDSAGNLGSISSGALDNSQIYAGVGVNGAATFPPVSAFPAGALIAGVHLKKLKGADSMVNSSIAASRINSLSLANIQVTNGGVAFGVEANVIASLGAINPATGKPFTFPRLTSAAIVAADLAAKGIIPQDFEIDIV